jgi:hypothetical protein
VPKLDGLHKHSGEESVSMQNLDKRYANIYINLNKQHAKNERIYGRKYMP